EDFEFSDEAGASHLAAHAPQRRTDPQPEPVHASSESPSAADGPRWDPSAQKELKKIPFFVRGRARQNTETFAAERGIHPITVETLYDAKAHFAR
ncbi:MAG: ferredoxin:protochlorophyllide reductase (ATP-dependent) subunit B, partial [Pseudomonadota bacterium]